MVWAAVTGDGAYFLHFFETGTKVDTAAYLTAVRAFVRWLARHIGCDVLSLKDQNWSFQQDGATCHTTRSSLSYLRSKFGHLITKVPECHRDAIDWEGTTTEPWPPRSPDLSPLDFWFWNRLVEKTFCHPRPRTIPQLKNKIRAAAASIPVDEVKRSVRAMKTRCERVLEIQGRHLKYK